MTDFAPVVDIAANGNFVTCKAGGDALMLFQRLEAELIGNPVLMAGPVADDDVDRIEEFAEFQLPPSYRDFVKRYGAAIVGPYPVFGRGASEAMSVIDASVIDVTKRFRADNWPTTDNALVVSTDHAGNAFTLSSTGSVDRFDHDSGTSETISESFEGFLEWCMSR